MLQMSTVSLLGRLFSFIVSLAKDRQLKAHSRADCCPVMVYSNGEQPDEDFFLPSNQAAPPAIVAPHKKTSLCLLYKANREGQNALWVEPIHWILANRPLLHGRITFLKCKARSLQSHFQKLGYDIVIFCDTSKQKQLFEVESLFFICSLLRG